MVWETAASLADPASDLDVILQINEALAGAGGSSSTSSSTAAASAGHLPTPALTPVTVPIVSEADTSAAPQPQKTAEAGIAAPHANGVIAAGQTNLSSGSGSAQKSPISFSAAAAAAKGDDSKQAPKAFKGFLSRSGGVSGDSKQSATGASTASNAAAASSSSSGKSSSSDVNNVVDIDCAAEQQKQQQKQRATPVSFGEQVQQQQQHSVMLTIAINQVRGVCVYDLCDVAVVHAASCCVTHSCRASIMHDAQYGAVGGRKQDNPIVQGCSLGRLFALISSNMDCHPEPHSGL